MYGSNASFLSRKDIKRFGRQRTAFLVLKTLSLVLYLVLTVVLAWLRVDWGITDWVHQVPPHRHTLFKARVFVII
jgi:hypothetical protein